MASENAEIDNNNKPVAMAITDDSNQYRKMFRIDDTTKGLKVMLVGGSGTGTITSITAGTGLTATAANPIVASGTIALDSKLAPLDTLGSAGQSIRVNAGVTALEYYTPSVGTGTVTAVSTASASNGITATWATNTTTPALTIAGANLTPTSVNGLTLASQAIGFTIAGGTTYKTLTVPLDASVSGTNTGDQNLSGYALIGQTMYIGTTAVAINRTTGALALTGITSIDGSSASTTGNAATVTNGMYTNANQTATGQNKFNNIIDVNNAITASGNAATVPITYRLNTVTNNSAATLTITMTTTSAVDGQMTIVRIYDFSGVAQTLTLVNTENSTVTAPASTNGSTTLPVTLGFMFNSATTKWRLIASA